MLARLNRFARAHERGFITTFWTVFIGGLAWACSASVQSGAISAELVVGLWAGSALIVVLIQVRLWLLGRLIIRDPQERARIQMRIQTMSRRSLPVAVGVAVAFSFMGDDVKTAFASVFGGALLGIAPVLLWITWVFRPDQRKGEWL